MAAFVPVCIPLDIGARNSFCFPISAAHPIREAQDLRKVRFLAGSSTNLFIKQTDKSPRFTRSISRDRSHTSTVASASADENDCAPPPQPPIGRREALAVALASVTWAAMPPIPASSVAGAAEEVVSASAAEEITEKVYLEFDVQGRKYGRVTIGLFGKKVPKTATEFVFLASKKSPFLTYKNSQVQRIIPGRGIEGGKIRQTLKEPLPGSVYVNSGPNVNNPELTDISRFGLRHDVAGLLSVSTVDGLQFAITTAPAPEWDKDHLVAGRVLEGLDVLERLQKNVPIVEPQPDKKLFVAVGQAIGDARAKAPAFYKPLAKVRVTDCGVL